MAHDVFISHSSKDKTFADAVCATLEGKNIRCWIAPRDVPPGTHYGAALDKAIEGSNIFILLISKRSNKSDQVIRELEIAADNGIPIIPIRIEEIEPTDAMRYYVKSLHWLDAMTPPLERHLEKITAAVQTFLSVANEQEILPEAAPFLEKPQKKHLPLPLQILLLIGMVALLVFVGWYGLTKLNGGRDIKSSVQLQELTLEAELASTLSTSDSNSIPPDWIIPEFIIPGNGSWNKEAGRYTAIGYIDTIAWSEEKYTGDIEISLDIESPPDIESSKDYAAAFIIVYGNGITQSSGNLIFNVANDILSIVEGSIYDDNDYTFIAGSDVNFIGEKHTVLINIIDRKATLFVDGVEIGSVFLKDTTDTGGKIGLWKYWEIEEIIFSNIRIKGSEYP